MSLKAPDLAINRILLLTNSEHGIKFLRSSTITTIPPSTKHEARSTMYSFDTFQALTRQKSQGREDRVRLEAKTIAKHKHFVQTSMSRISIKRPLIVCLTEPSNEWRSFRFVFRPRNIDFLKGGTGCPPTFNACFFCVRRLVYNLAVRWGLSAKFDECR